MPTDHRAQLPLSFCATLFGMNAAEFNDGHYTLAEELIYMRKSERPQPEKVALLTLARAQSPSRAP